MHFEIQSAIVGALGGLLYEISRWAAFQTEETLPLYFRKIHYWLISVSLVITGGILAGFLVSPAHITALFVGISAPSIISRIRATYGEGMKLGTKNQEKKIPRVSLRDWLKG